MSAYGTKFEGDWEIYSKPFLHPILQKPYNKHKVGTTINYNVKYLFSNINILNNLILMLKIDKMLKDIWDFILLKEGNATWDYRARI